MPISSHKVVLQRIIRINWDQGDHSNQKGTGPQSLPSWIATASPLSFEATFGSCAGAGPHVGMKPGGSRRGMVQRHSARRAASRARGHGCGGPWSPPGADGPGTLRALAAKAPMPLTTRR